MGTMDIRSLTILLSGSLQTLGEAAFFMEYK